MLFTPDGRDEIIPRASPKGQLVERMEREWYDAMQAAPLEIRQLPRDNIEVLKRFFMVGFTCGAKWAQSKGQN